MPSEIELKVAGLTKRFSPQVTIGPISFDVTEGEFFSLLGPSGCGKTTMLRCIAGFEVPSEGSIFLRGERLDDKPPYRRDVGMVFQNYALFPHLTVFENVAFGLRIQRINKMEAKNRVNRLLELVGLPELGERYPAQLSGGQRQRIAIARSLALEPRLLLLDEPLSNLDLKMRIQMRRELRNLQQKLGKTSIYVTHDQSEALALSDRIAVLSQGMIEQIGTPIEIYESPGSAFVADFIGSSNIVHATVEESLHNKSLVRTDHGLRLMVAAVSESAGSRVMIMLRPEKFRIIGGTSGAPEGVNHFRARLETLTYLGEDIQMQVIAAEDERLLVSIKSSMNLRGMKPGDPVVLAIDPEDLHLLRR